MKKKKNSNKNLEKFRIIFFETGIILSLLLVLGAFEWAVSPEIDAMSSIGKGNSFENDISVISTVRKEEKQLPNKPRPIEIINIIDNNDPVLNDSDFPDIEFTGNDPDYSNWVILETPDEDFSNEVIDFIAVQDKPLFMGGNPEISFRKFIANHVVYPETAIENGVMGTVVLQFIVNKNGKLSDVKVLGSAHPDLDKEAIRVLSLSSSLWSPGKQSGKPVNVRYYFPVVFRISY
jgi:periplasmic protein TonB